MRERMSHASRLLLAVVLLALAGGAGASYNEECRTLAERLDRDPASLKVGELDLLKNCLADLQRIIVLGDTPPAQKPPQLCPEPPPPEPCPACKACPAAEPAPAAPAVRERPRKRDREEDVNLRPQLQPF